MAKSDKTKKPEVRLSAEVTEEVIEEKVQQDSERTKAVDALVFAYLGKQRIEEAFTVVRQEGTSSQTRQVLLTNILAAENLEVGGTTGKVKMALEVVSLGVPHAAIQDFVNKIMEENWLNSEAEKRVFIEAKDYMLETVKPLIDGVIKACISNGYLSSAKEAATLLGRKLSVDEINVVIEKHCRDGNIDNALDVIRQTKRRKLTVKEIEMLTEAVDKQQKTKPKKKS